MTGLGRGSECEASRLLLPTMMYLLFASVFVLDVLCIWMLKQGKALLESVRRRG
jgi:hypothetical protein